MMMKRRYRPSLFFKDIECLPGVIYAHYLADTEHILSATAHGEAPVAFNKLLAVVSLPKPIV